MQIRQDSFEFDHRLHKAISFTREKSTAMRRVRQWQQHSPTPAVFLLTVLPAVDGLADGFTGRSVDRCVGVFEEALCAGWPELEDRGEVPPSAQSNETACIQTVFKKRKKKEKEKKKRIGNQTNNSMKNTVILCYSRANWSPKRLRVWQYRPERHASILLVFRYRTKEGKKEKVLKSRVSVRGYVWDLGDKHRV